MNYTQNEKIMSITEGTLVIGIDIAKQFQYARAFDYRGIELIRIFFTIITKRIEYDPQKLMKDTGFNLRLKVA